MELQEVELSETLAGARTRISLGGICRSYTSCLVKGPAARVQCPVSAYMGPLSDGRAWCQMPGPCIRCQGPVSDGRALYQMAGPGIRWQGPVSDVGATSGSADPAAMLTRRLINIGHSGII